MTCPFKWTLGTLSWQLTSLRLTSIRVCFFCRFICNSKVFHCSGLGHKVTDALYLRSLWLYKLHWRLSVISQCALLHFAFTNQCRVALRIHEYFRPIVVLVQHPENFIHSMFKVCNLSSCLHDILIHRQYSRPSRLHIVDMQFSLWGPLGCMSFNERRADGKVFYG